MNEELYELNVIDKPFRFPDEFQVIWKSQTCRINSFINSRESRESENFNLWIWFNSRFLNFMWMRKNFGYFSWCMKRRYIFTWLSSAKGFRGLLLLMEWEGWIGKIVSVRWAWGKMKSGFFFKSPGLKLCLCIRLPKKTKPSTWSRVEHTHHQTTVPLI